MASKTQRVKQRSLHAVETILRARLLQKVNILQQRTVVLLLRRTSIKNLEKREIKSETFATWKYCKYSQIVRPKKFEEKSVAFSLFYSTGSDRILGNDKGVGVSVFTNRKIKTTKKRNTPEWPWVKGQHCIRSARLTLGFFSVAAYGLSKKFWRSDQRQFSLTIDKSKYIVSFWGPCVWFCTFQLHYNSSNLDTTQDIYKFTDKMWNGNGLQGLTCWAASFWNLLITL